MDFSYLTCKSFLATQSDHKQGLTCVLLLPNTLGEDRGVIAVALCTELLQS